jgi:integrase
MISASDVFDDEAKLCSICFFSVSNARRDLVEFLRWTGWRRDEGRLLTWANVDRETKTLHLTAAQAKAKEPRVFPFALAPDLVALFARRWDARDGLYVFHLDGAPIGIGALRSAWGRATSRAGLTGRLLHDLRRTRARELRRVLAESDIMELCGWETREVFKRYAIKDECHLEQSVGRAFALPATETPASGTPGAHSGATPTPNASGG